MTGNQIAIVLDTGLSLDDGEQQIAEHTHSRTQEAIHNGNEIINIKVESQIQNQAYRIIPSMAASKPPTAPSMVLLGLTTGASLCLPRK